MHGLLVLDKPLRMSSAQAVAIVKRKAGGVKVGHAGTLDPLATGVLVLALGSATKSIAQVMATDKRYRTVIDLSAFTTTDDAEGERILDFGFGILDSQAHDAAADAGAAAQSKIQNPKSKIGATPQSKIQNPKSKIESTLAAFTGSILQTPPAYSAVKVAGSGGRRAYSIARGGGPPPELAPRTVIAHELKLVRYEWPQVELDIHCGKGFYVRALARDLGKALGTGGFCASIRRTAVGPYTVEMARTIEQLPERITQEDLIAAGAP